MTSITCPNCDNRFPVTDGAADYDWVSGSYYGGVKQVLCPYCQKALIIYAQATVDIEEVKVDD